MVADPPLPTPSNVSLTNDFSFLIELLDIHTLETSIKALCSGEELPIQALTKSGYLGNMPTTPSLTISFRTLEFFWHTRLCKLSFSIEAFAKVICNLYAISPCPADTL